MAHRPGTRPGGPRRPPARRPQPDLARQAAYDALRAVEEPTRTRTWSCHRCCATGGLRPGTRRSRPSSRTARCAFSACTTQFFRQRSTAHSTWMLRFSTSFSARRSTSSSTCGCPHMRRWPATVELARAVIGEGRSRFVKCGPASRRRSLTRRLAVPAGSAVRIRSGGKPRGRSRSPAMDCVGLSGRLGGSLDETASALAADNDPAQVSLVARPGRSSVDELFAAGASPGRWSPYAATLPSGNPRACRQCARRGRHPGRGQSAGCPRLGRRSP